MISSSGAWRGLSAEKTAEAQDLLAQFLGLTRDQVTAATELAARKGIEFPVALVELGIVGLAEVAVALSAIRGASDGRSLIPLKAPDVRHELVVHSVPSLRISERLWYVAQMGDDRSERIRSLRAQILLTKQYGARSSALALASPGRGEGRTQLAAELAISFAQSGRKTLLVDADLRNPAQHELFLRDESVQVSPGDDGTLVRGVHGLPSLSVLFAGDLAVNTADSSWQPEVFWEGRFEQLLESWRRVYDVILLDTPAMNVCADALAVTRAAGQVLLLGRANHTSHKDIAAALRQFGPTRASIMGAVLNRW